jgi:ABC-type transport system involved in multi-copper enzyme maturation permease subunit
MTLLPVIMRELRTQARQPASYWLRVVAAGVVFGMLTLLLLRFERAFGLWGMPGVARGTNTFSVIGTALFGFLNATIFACNVFLVPMLTADCISREKREGTLGLLFLTPLSAPGIVAGKSFVHMLRGVVLFVAMLPVLAIPLLLGGVAYTDFVMALLIDSIVLVLALAAGLLASTYTRDWIKAFILAELLSLFFVGAFMVLHSAWFSQFWPGFASKHSRSFAQWFTGVFCFHVNIPNESLLGIPTFGRGSMATGIWSEIPALLPGVHTKWFTFVAGCFIAALMFFAAVILLSARQVRASWREEPASARLTGINQALTRPRFGIRFLRRKLSRSLDRNPIGWLQHYSWSGRITKWGWFGVIVAVESFLIADFWEFADVQPGIVLVLLCGLAFAAAGSFRKERENGALELLLVCPLSVTQIMWGRLRGIWAQFLPSFSLLALCLYVGVEMQPSYRDDRQHLYWFYIVLAMAFVVLPILGLFLSLHTVNFLPAWLWTMALGIGLPLLGLGRETAFQLIAFYIQCGIGLLAWFLLRDDLSQRRFVVHA